MKRIMLTVAYDGTHYHGWQFQPNQATIEGELNKALSEALGENIVVIGASRTDAGVHAKCNVAVFDTESCIPAEKICYCVNRYLPADIVVQSSCETDAAFHPRHCDTKKTYEYRLYCATFPMPDRMRYTHFVYKKPDIVRMQEAAKYFIGEHDFKSFCSTGTVVETTVRTVYDVSVIEEGCEVMIRVCGAGFLYNMVRIMAGTLLEVGYGKIEPDEIKDILEACDREKAGPTLPANGLMLLRYEFV